MGKTLRRPAMEKIMKQIKAGERLNQLSGIFGGPSSPP